MVGTSAVKSSATAAKAQPARKVYRIGLLSGGPRPVTAGPTPIVHSLREIGYVEGQTIMLEIRWNEGKPERYPALAAELVALKVDVIVAGTGGATEAAKHATGTIPIVMASHPDPIRAGHVVSLARPGGHRNARCRA